MTDDLEHLKILSILHYVFGALIGLFACMHITPLAVGIYILTREMEGLSEDPTGSSVGIFFILKEKLEAVRPEA